MERCAGRRPPLSQCASSCVSSAHCLPLTATVGAPWYGRNRPIVFRTASLSATSAPPSRCDQAFAYGTDDGACGLRPLEGRRVLVPRAKIGRRWSMSARVDGKLVIDSDCLVRIPKKPSIWFSHDALVGV